MAIPFLLTLPASARAIYPIVRRGVKDGMAIKSIGESIRGAGYKISNANLSKMVNKEREIWAKVANFKFLGLDAHPNPFRMPEALTMIRRNFSYTVFVRGIEKATGLEASRYITITSDTNLTRRTIQDLAERLVAQGDSDDYTEVMESRLDSALVKPGFINR